MSAWVLPDHIADVLPSEARRIEELRRGLLDTARSYGYELVMPPLLEHLESLLTGTGEALDLQTFKLVDQLSGRSLGVRADTTQQVARIDAHLLTREGVARLCYCGPGTFTGPRPAAEPIRPAVLFELATPADLMNARLVIEPAMAAEAAERASASDIAALRTLATQTRDARDWRTYEAADSAFHRAIATATSNHLLMAILGLLSMVRDRAPWQRQHGRAFGHGPHWEYSLRQGDLHLSLVDAIAAGDGPRAHAVMREHLGEIAQLMTVEPA